MLGGLRDEAAEVAQELVAHAVVLRHAAFVGDPSQGRVEVLPGALQAQEEREMVDPHDVVVELRRRDPEVRARARPPCAARSGRGRRSRIELASATRPAQHRHRVDIVAAAAHRDRRSSMSPADVEQHGDRAQPAHDPADAQRVADRLAQPEALRHVEVDHGRGAVTADLERGDDVIGAGERRAAIQAWPRCPPRRRAGASARSCPVRSRSASTSMRASVAVVRQRRDAEDVPDECPGEDCAEPAPMNAILGIGSV